VRLKTVFSNNIRNNFGFLNRCERETGAPADPQDAPDTDKLFIQQGRKVFKDVTPMVGELILGHLADLGIEPAQVKRQLYVLAEVAAHFQPGRTYPEREVNAILKEVSSDSYVMLRRLLVDFGFLKRDNAVGGAVYTKGLAPEAVLAAHSAESA
jgi:beta-ketodecanoyl-[acyl-carrier-protein] synthase